MRSRFDYHDFAAYVIPGLLPCLVAILVVFARGHYRLYDFILTFSGLILLLIFAYLVGHMLQSIAAWFEKRIFYSHGYHPGESFLWQKSGFLSPRNYDRMLGCYREKFGIDLKLDDLDDPARREELFSEMRWGVYDDVREEYIRVLDTYYDLYRGLFVAFMICAIMSIPIAFGLLPVPLSFTFYQKVFWMILIGSIIGEYISFRRTHDYLASYTREVMNAFLSEYEPIVE